MSNLGMAGARAGGVLAGWGIILAGGEGLRLRALTRRIVGDERPKQFCPILGGETLLALTRRRVALTIAADRTVVVLTRSHERFYTPLLAHVPPRSVLIQPQNRETAPAILYSLLRLAAWAPTDSVAIFPSDHYVSDDAAFMAHVEAAFEAVSIRSDVVILLGITPDRPEVDYGWIEAGDPIPLPLLPPHVLYRVRRFCEKPSMPLARALRTRGGLWNSFVMVGRISALLGLIKSAVPEVFAMFSRARLTRDAEGNDATLRTLYAHIPPVNFSRQVLATRPAKLAVLPVSGTSWSDWGEPSRVMASLARLRVQPAWSRRSRKRRGGPALARPGEVGWPSVVSPRTDPGS